MPNLDPEYRDRTSPVWDMSQERVFLEGVMNQRFNFFLVFFSLVLAGSINAKSDFHLHLVLYLGAVITALLSFVIWRAHGKLNTILGFLYQDPSHPVTLVEQTYKRAFSVRRIVGYVIPGLCSVILWVGALLSSFNMLPALPRVTETQTIQLRQDIDHLRAQVRGVETRIAKLERPVIQSATP